MEIKKENSENTHSELHTQGEVHGHIKAMIAVIFIMLIFVFGGLYMWGTMLKNKPMVPHTETPIINNEPETPRANADIQILETLSPSDEISAIEADLESTNFDALDSELNTIDSEFNALPTE